MEQFSYTELLLLTEMKTKITWEYRQLRYTVPPFIWDFLPWIYNKIILSWDSWDMILPIDMVDI